MKRRNEDVARIPTDYVVAVSKVGAEATVLSPFELHPEEQRRDGVEVRTGLDPDDPAPLTGAAGLILTGGGDVDPSFFGQARHPRTYNISPVRDRFEFTLLQEALETDMPVLAICRGMQLLNVHFGGTLEQHLADGPQRLDHDRDRPRGEPAHNLRVKESSIVAEILQAPRAAVNSHHHQGVDVPGHRLEEVGWAEDGVVEALVSRDHSWVVGLQWHPETMAPVDPVQVAVFETFVEATRAFARRGREPARATSGSAGRP